MRWILLLLPLCLSATGLDSLIGMSKGMASVAASTTYVNAIEIGGMNINVSEPGGEGIFQTAGTLAHLSVYCATYDRGTGTVKTRTAATYGGTPGDGAETASITGSGETSDPGTSDSVTLGTFWAISITTGSGGTTAQIPRASIVFTPTSSTTVTRWGGNSAQTLAINASYYEPVNGYLQTSNTGSVTESQFQLKSQSIGTWRNLWVNLSVNGVGATSTLKSRVATANGGQSASVTASTTGHFEDTVGTDTLAVNSLVDVMFTVGNSAGTFTTQSYGSEFGTSNNTQMWASQLPTSGGKVLAAGATAYICPMGDMSSDITQANYAARAKVLVIVTKLQVQVLTNSLTASHVTTFKVFKNGSAGSGAVSNTAQNTGYLIDASGSDSLGVNDTTSIQAVAPSGGTSIAFNGLSVLATLQAPPASGVIRHRVM